MVSIRDRFYLEVPDGQLFGLVDLVGPGTSVAFRADPFPPEKLPSPREEPKKAETQKRAPSPPKRTLGHM